LNTELTFSKQLNDDLLTPGTVLGPERGGKERKIIMLSAAMIVILTKTEAINII